MEPFLSTSASDGDGFVLEDGMSAVSGAVTLGKSALVAGAMTRSPALMVKRTPMTIRRERE